MRRTRTREPGPDSRRGIRAIRRVIADDHEGIRRALIELFTHRADVMALESAGDGAGALDICRAVRADVVPMDLGMPMMDGIEATRRLAPELPGTRSWS